MSKRKKENRGMTRREFTKYSGIALGAFGVAGLFPGAKLFAATPKMGGHFKPASVGYTVVRSLDPAHWGWLCEMQVGTTMFNSLVRFDETMGVVPDLAKSWTMPNETTYRFELYPGIKFHDGSECTSEDVVFSLERVMDPKTGSPHQGKFSQIEQVRAVDSHTVEITTQKPFAPLMAYLCNARTGSQIVPKKVVEKMGAEFGKNPIGTGPFKLVDWKPGEKLEFVRHDQYFMKGLPYLDKVTEYLISEQSAASNAIAGGDVDLISTVLFSDVKTLEKTKGLKVLRKPGLNVRFFLLNCKKKPFDDMWARKAFAHSFDRQNLIDAVIYGEGGAIQGIIPPAIKWAYHPTLNTQTFNPEKAREYLKKSKYGKSDINFTILTWGTGWWKRWAEIVAAQSSEVLGVQIGVQSLEAGTVNTRNQKGDYTCSVWGWRGLVEPDEYAYENFHSQGSKNYFQYSNPEVDDLLEKARTTMDKSKRTVYYNRAEEIVGEEAPCVFCFNNYDHKVLRDSVEGFVHLQYDAFGSQFDRVWLSA